MSTQWLVVTGREEGALADSLSNDVANKIREGKFAQKDVEYLSRLDRSVVTGTLSVRNDRLEILRKLCQLWEIEVTPPKITSHRKVVGPIIVFGKRLLFPILKMLLKDTIRKQRDFNATTITLLTELCQQGREEITRPEK